jgi:hypothetical protein
MKLNLQLHSSPRGPVRAAFLRGNDPQQWLSTIQSWGIPPNDLEAYAVPQSKSDLQVAGLLLIHRNGHFPAQLDLQEAYRCIAQALLIPQYASIQPQVAEEEWKNLLFYDWHFFHPGLGMVGFQHCDRVNLADLLTYPAALEQDWTLAKAGPPSAPLLRQISVLQPKVEDIFAQVQGVGDKDLKDLSKNKPSAEDGKDIRSTLLSSLEKLLSQRPNLREGESQGWLGKMLDRLEMRISKILADLQKQRESEIDRLLKLYQDDPEEALRYSIPLDNPYEGRGIAPPSGLLGRNNAPDFNLGGLNTGGPRDNWELDAQRQIALRQHYLHLANQKIADGDYRKAAYIHAHLLGDFHTAANVLEQGKHFYEAAILYRDHLKDKQRAAQCFEKGGLYTEAIDLYLELGQKEKAGDLYTQIDQWTEAEKLYQNCAEEALKTSNHLEAARIYDHKLKDQNEAKVSLLKGWHDKLNPTACLNRYFEFFQQANNAEFDAEVQRIYQTEYKPVQRNAFMEVLKEIGKNKQRKADLPNTREIVYHVVSNELQSDILDHVGMLETFVPKDRLLGGDVSRYEVSLKERQKKAQIRLNNDKWILVKTIDLSPEVETWLEARMLNQKLVALGQTGEDVYLQCADLELFNECVKIKEGRAIDYPHKPQLVALPYNSPYLSIIHIQYLSGAAVQFIEERFGKDMQSSNLHRLKGQTIGLGVIDGKTIAQLVLLPDGALNLNICTEKGAVKKTFLCVDAKDHSNKVRIRPPSGRRYFELMPFMKGYFYFITPDRSTVLRIDELGNTIGYQPDTPLPILKMALSDGYSAERMVIHSGDETYNVRLQFCCQYFRPDADGFNPCGESFENQSLECLLFTHNGLIVTDEKYIRLYNTRGVSTPRLVDEFELEEEIVDVFKGPSVHQVGFLTKKGKVLFYEIGNLNA